MSDLQDVRRLVDAAARSLERSRARIDDLNVYPVPDGDTGTNMALTVRAIADALDSVEDAARPALARALTRAALMGARGNSGVILSQIVRGAAEALGEHEGEVTPEAIAAALQGASDAAYRGVRTPVEGTMLTVIREMAEEAQGRSQEGQTVTEVLRAVLVRSEDALARTPTLLAVLREAGVVDAGGAGLVELMRGIVASVTGESLPEPAPPHALGVEATHRELSEFRYCTAFVVEGEALDRDELEAAFERLGDSLLVVGDESALKVHVHTDDPGAALSLATARGSLAGVEIADMHAQTVDRERRLEAARPPASTNASDVVAVVAGEGNRRQYLALGAAVIVEGGQSMNPSTSAILEAVQAAQAAEVIVLPNNGNVVSTAEQAAELASKPVHVVPSRSMQAGLAALLSFDPSRSAGENAAAMRDAATSIATAAVTTASRDVELDGRRIRAGEYLGLVEDEPLLGGQDFDDVATAVVERLLDETHDTIVLLTGEDAPSVEGVVSEIERRHPQLELDVQPGGQPHYHLLISAE